MHGPLRTGLVALLATIGSGAVLAGICPNEPLVQNHVGGGTVACTCFVAGEEAGAIFNVPAADYPIQIVSVGIGWGSTNGGQPDALEEAFHIYATGLPNPGVPIFTQVAPVLTDGAVNLFNVDLAAEVILDSGPFMVTLEFLNDNVGGGPFTPTVPHDGAGCVVGRNSVFAIPGGWFDACFLGVSGNWVFVVEYRKVTCGSSGPGAVPDGADVPGAPLVLDRGAASTLELSWGVSCSASDETYSIYEGTLGSFSGHLPKNCDTGTTAANVSPAIGNTYYLVVPRDGSNEGSYGADSAGTPRPPAIATCRPPLPSTCF
jgi:hypothetical protein